MAPRQSLTSTLTALSLTALSAGCGNAHDRSEVSSTAILDGILSVIDTLKSDDSEFGAKTIEIGNALPKDTDVLIQLVPNSGISKSVTQVGNKEFYVQEASITGLDDIIDFKYSINYIHGWRHKDAAKQGFYVTNITFKPDPQRHAVDALNRLELSFNAEPAFPAVASDGTIKAMVRFHINWKVTNALIPGTWKRNDMYQIDGETGEMTAELGVFQ